LARLQIENGLLAAAVSIDWLNTSATPEEQQQRQRVSTNDDDGGSDLRVEISEQHGHHVTVWLHEGIVNDLLMLMDWNLLIINTSIPVTSEMLPPRSRRFLSTMCIECYFNLNVWGNEIPRLHIGNDTIMFET
jgi:hypothetical protein